MTSDSGSASHDRPGAIDSALRRELSSRGHHLKVRFTVGRQGLTDSVIETVRQGFARAELIKVRVDADDSAETEAAAHQLAMRVPCCLVRRVGRVLLLYRPGDAGRTVHHS